MVVSLLGVLLVNWIGAVTLGGVAWVGANVVVWVALCLLLAGTEQPKITWILARSTRLVEFSRVRGARKLPRWELSAAVCFFALLIGNWLAAFRDGTVVFPLAAAALGVARVVRRAPFSRWQWIGCVLLPLHQFTMAFGGAPPRSVAVTVWFEVVLWWMFTHRAVKREDDGLAARMALTKASYSIADGQFVEAERQVRAAMPLATTKEIAAAALQVLAATLCRATAPGGGGTRAEGFAGTESG